MKLTDSVAHVAAIKVSSKVEQAEWQALQALARESHQSISGLLTEAIADYLRKRRLRPVVLKRVEDSMVANEDLGRRLGE
jgi:predicted transcriptional regulator